MPLQQIHTEAWVLPAGRGPLQQQAYTFAFDSQTEVLIAPLYGCWEANMDHALQRDPVDVCQLRDEPEVVLGNGGVVRVLEPDAHSGLTAGQVCLLLSFGPIDHPLGYPRLAHAYDTPGSVGLLARTSKALPHQLLPLPVGLGSAELSRWAAFALRYVTAWGNWEMALGAYRLLVPEFLAGPAPWVLAWGGGVALAELQLAKAAGFQVGMFSSRPARCRALAAEGIVPLQRGRDERAALAAIRELTADQGAAIFVDLIGGEVWPLTLKALARPGVLTTAGWKAGMSLSYQRALTCMFWQHFVHTHYARPDQARAAVAYAQARNWLPPPADQIWAWEEIPALAAAYQQGLDTYFPVYAVNSLD